MLCGVARITTAVDIAFQHLQPQPVALFLRHRVGHFLRQYAGFAHQRLRVMNQLKIGIAGVAIDRQLQGVDPTRAGGDQRNHRTAKACRKGIDVDTNFLLLGNIEHVQRDDARNTQLQQLQGQVQVTLKIGGIDDVNQ
ncbi:hypothetical protein D3C85_1148910 [compost metagenome]